MIKLIRGKWFYFSRGKRKQNNSLLEYLYKYGIEIKMSKKETREKTLTEFLEKGPRIRLGSFEENKNEINNGL